MNETAIKIMMWVGGGIMSLLFFLVSFYFYRSIKAYDDLSESVNKLQLTLSGLNGIILSMQEKNTMFSSNCKEKHVIIDNRLKAHARDLERHEIQITKLETLQQNP